MKLPFLLCYTARWSDGHVQLTKTVKWYMVGEAFCSVGSVGP